MQSAVETPVPARTSPVAATGPSIPIEFYLAAAKDAELKLLLRQRETAKRRVQRAVKAEADAEQEIAAYVAKTYPVASESA